MLQYFLYDIRVFDGRNDLHFTTALLILLYSDLYRFMTSCVLTSCPSDVHIRPFDSQLH